MGQFFSLTYRGDLNGTTVINTLWYYRDTLAGDPTDADLDALEDDFQAQGWPNMRPAYSTQYRLKQTVVQGYTGAWNRMPYLPQIRDYDAAGTAVGAAAPPISCAILGFRIIPKVDGPHRNPDGTYRLRPVRRGYLAVSGIEGTAFNANGSLSTTWSAASPANTFRTAVTRIFAISTASEVMQPIRVSALAPDRTDRGYGTIQSAQWRTATSSRRSRKLGTGV